VLSLFESAVQVPENVIFSVGARNGTSFSMYARMSKASATSRYEG
jgi:hypothetical protein